MWWKAAVLINLILVVVAQWTPPPPAPKSACQLAESNRTACGYPDIRANECLSLAGCCWRPCWDCEQHVPWCFRPTEDVVPDVEEPVVELPQNASEGDIYLVDGDSNENGTSGRVLIYHAGQWGTVYYDGFNFVAALIVCRQLGFDTGRPVFFGPGTGPIWLGYFQCAGHESSLSECHLDYGWGSFGYHHDFDIGVICKNPEYEEGALRIVNQTKDHLSVSGRLEVYHGGEWGTVCSLGFHVPESDIACRQMGYYGGLAKGAGKFGQGTRDIWLGALECAGTEKRLIDCKHANWGGTWCRRYSDTGIICYYHLPITQGSALPQNASEGDVQLVDGDEIENGITGRIMIYHDGEWGTICSDWFNASAVLIVCRQLGFNTGYQARFGPGIGPIWLEDFQCGGEESSLAECHLPFGWVPFGCTHYSDAGVVCGNDSEDGALRIVNQTKDHLSVSGRLEVYLEGEWGTVCSHGFDVPESDIACRQMGYYGGEPGGAGQFGQGTGNIWLDALECVGTEKRLIDCINFRWGLTPCKHNHDTGIVCYYPVPITEGSELPQNAKEGDVQLVDGDEIESGISGRIMIYHAGQWGTVCSQWFNASAVHIVCRQLGFNTGYQARFGPGLGPIWFEELECGGEESSLAQCSLPFGWVCFSCAHYSDAGVVCKNKTQDVGEAVESRDFEELEELENLLDLLERTPST